MTRWLSKTGFLLTTLTSLPVASTARALAGIGASRAGPSFENSQGDLNGQKG
jgi:hypothetical protein